MSNHCTCAAVPFKLFVLLLLLLLLLLMLMPFLNQPPHTHSHFLHSPLCLLYPSQPPHN